MVQNDTIEERIALLEEQVVDLQDDITVIQDDVADLDQEVIQDERLFELEQTSDEVVVELAEINANILGNLKGDKLENIVLNTLML